MLPCGALGSGDLNLELPACMTSTLPIEPSLLAIRHILTQSKQGAIFISRGHVAMPRDNFSCHGCREQACQCHLCPRGRECCCSTLYDAEDTLHSKNCCLTQRSVVPEVRSLSLTAPGRDGAVIFLAVACSVWT